MDLWHLSHPFYDKHMAFGVTKQLVDLALQGKLEYVREKLMVKI